MPVAAKIALPSAGAAGGTGGSPMPRIFVPFSRPTTTISGHCVEAHGLVVVVVLLLRASIGIGDLAIHRVAEAEDDAPLHEVLEIHRVDDGAHVADGPDLVDPMPRRCW
jgi:hypothetical protein